MKIVHLCISAFFIDNYSYQENMLTKYHVKQGHNVTVIASLFTFAKDGSKTYMNGPCEYINGDGVKVIRLAYKPPFVVNKILRHYQNLYKSLEKEKPDIIFSHGISARDMEIVRKYIIAYPSVKLFGDSHADYVNSAKNGLSKYILHPIIWRYYAKRIEPYMIKCFGVTPMRCRFLKEMYHLKDEKIGFLPMGVDDEAIPKNREKVRIAVRNELNIPKEDFMIITGGKIDFLKNTHVLIEAMDIINNPHFHLVICGVLTEKMKYLKKVINERSSNIHYLGWCSAERVINCMVASDIACFPGTHSTLWEQAVGIGLPSIFKRWSEMEHVYVNGNCIFVRGDDAEELKNAIIEMSSAENFEKYVELSKEASKQFKYSEIAKRAIGVN